MRKDAIANLSESLQEEEFKENGIEEILLRCRDMKRTNGIKGSGVQNNITLDDYVDYLQSYVEKRFYQNLIRSGKHNVSTISKNRP